MFPQGIVGSTPTGGTTCAGRAGLRSQWGDPWEFESPPRHQAIENRAARQAGAPFQKPPGTGEKYRLELSFGANAGFSLFGYNILLYINNTYIISLSICRTHYILKITGNWSTGSLVQGSMPASVRFKWQNCLKRASQIFRLSSPANVELTHWNLKGSQNSTRSPSITSWGLS